MYIFAKTLKKNNMNRLLVFTLICTHCLVLFYSCSETKDIANFGGATCDCCNSIGGKTIKVYNGDTLIFYNAFTPSNLAFCDSIEVDNQNYITTINYKKNIDTIYNDKINQYYKIEGIEKFPYNELLIYSGEYPINRILVYTNYCNPYNGKIVFNGIRIDTTNYGHLRQKLLAQGKYNYILKLYNDRYHNSLKDSISGHFCIIRNKEMTIQGCEGADPMDPLLH